MTNTHNVVMKFIHDDGGDDIYCGCIKILDLTSKFNSNNINESNIFNIIMNYRLRDPQASIVPTDEGQPERLRHMHCINNN